MARLILSALSAAMIFNTHAHCAAADDSAVSQPRRLEYGDGKPNGKKSYGGSGRLIEFTLPDGEPRLKAIRIHGSRYGTARAPQEDFDVTILSEDMQEVIDIQRAPYGLFRRGDEKWVTVRFKAPIEAPKKFWVALDFHAHQTKGVYLSFDTETRGEHSRVGLVEEPDKVKPVDTGGDWMVQAVLDWKE